MTLETLRLIFKICTTKLKTDFILIFSLKAQIKP